MYDRVLYDKIAQNGRPIPNGMDHPGIIDMFEKGENWRRFSYYDDIPRFSPEKIALTHECDSGVYPLCIREPRVINPYTLNALIQSVGDRTLSLIRSGGIKLCWFVEKEAPKDVSQIFDIDKVMKDWNISNYAIFTNLSFHNLNYFSKRAYPSVSHELEVGIIQKNEIVMDCVREPKRFNVFMHTDNIYDWRLLFLNLLNRAGVIQHSILSFKHSARMIDTKSIDSAEINTYLERNESAIRSALSKYGYGYLGYDDVFANSSFSIVIEAYLDHVSVVNYPFITEKTMWAIVMGQPFIISGQAHSLPYLRERGYRTFSPHIDESYDRIENDLLRIKTVTAEIARINAMPPEEYKTLLQRIEPIVAHNIAQTHRNIETYYRRIFART